MLGIISKSCCIGVCVLLFFAIVGHGEVVVRGFRVTSTGHRDDPHPGHEQGEIAGVDVTHGAQQTVHSFLQHNVAWQRHGPVVQQPSK